MMRYLDREPQAGDRVHVEFKGELVSDHVLQGKSMRPDVVVVRAHGGLRLTAPMVSVRVIAPQSKVGDVVTADMDLPEGSIIEDRNGVVARRFPLAWNRLASSHFNTTADLLRTFADEWRIVRIGGAQ